MIALLRLFLVTLASPFKSKGQLAAENIALRHQAVVLQRQVRRRVRLTNVDRLILVQLYRWFPSILKVLAIVQGRPSIDGELRALIRRMSIDNPPWGAPRIHCFPE